MQLINGEAILNMNSYRRAEVTKDGVAFHTDQDIFSMPLNHEDIFFLKGHMRDFAHALDRLVQRSGAEDWTRWFELWKHGITH